MLHTARGGADETMTSKTQAALQRRVTDAAESALSEHNFVTSIDVLVGVGWLTPGRLDDWR